MLLWVVLVEGEVAEQNWLMSGESSNLARHCDCVWSFLRVRAAWLLLQNLFRAFFQLLRDSLQIGTDRNPSREEELFNLSLMKF